LGRVDRLVRVVAGCSWLFACAPDPDGSISAAPIPSAEGGAGPALDAGSAQPAADSYVPAIPLPVNDAGAEPLGDSSCAASLIEAKQVVVQQEVTVEERVDEVEPVALFITLDRSLSMDWEDLWVPAKDALADFVNAESSSGVDVALTFFPENGGDCDGSGYDTPVVAMGRLPDHATAVTRELDQRRSAGGVGTPIEGALRGATQFCQRFEATSNGEKCVAVLVTDGDPVGCEGSTSRLAAIAEAAYAGGNGIRTFAVGLKGADFDLLDEIAQSGGAVDCDTSDNRFACDVSSGPSQLSMALDKIRSVVTTVKTHVTTTTRVEEMPVECEWTIPAPPPGQLFDRARVNVQLSAPSLSSAIAFGQVPSSSACAERGWYYDDPSAPTRLIACPQTCAALRATAQARVDVLLGCATAPLL
jgi:hypothetical protein